MFFTQKQHLPREVIEIIEKVPERITHKVTMMARQDSNKDKEKLQSKEDLTIVSENESVREDFVK